MITARKTTGSGRAFFKKLAIMVLAMVIFLTPPTANAGGFGDIQKNVHTAQNEVASKNVVRVDVDPANVLAQAKNLAQMIKEYALKLKNYALDLKDYALQMKIYGVSVQQAVNFVKSHVEKLKADKDNTEAIGHTIAATEAAGIAANAALGDAAHARSIALQNANTAGQAAAAPVGASQMCTAATGAAIIEEGGAAGGPAGKGSGGGEVTTSRGRALGAAKLIAATGGPKDSASKPPTSEEVAKVALAVAADRVASAAANARGNAQSGVSYYKDQAKRFLEMYVSGDMFNGAAKVAGVPLSPDGDLKAGLNIRAGDLLPGNGPLSLLCFEKAAQGKFVLDGFDAAFCGRDKNQYWEKAVKEGAIVKVREPKKNNVEQPIKDQPLAPMQKTIDLSSAYVIRDYIVPAPFTSFTTNFLAALNDNTNNQEIFAKRMAFSAAASMIAGVYNQKIAMLTPQYLSPEKTSYFNNQWRQVYKATPPPPMPSARARNDLRIEQFRMKAVDNALNGMVSAVANNALAQAQIGTMTALSIGMQKDILYSLERIEMLLATMLSNDLQDRRASIEAQITAANDKK